MKKNMMMRIASVLLVAVLASTCAISGTFAKYVTSADGSDSARVAKWGVEIMANGTTFAEKYDTDDSTAGVGAYSVLSSTPTGVNTDHIIAPGTDGEMVAMTISGIPEVAVEVKYEATLTLTGWDVDITDNDVYDPVEYCPIIFTVNGVTYGMYGTTATNTFGSVAVLAQAVKEAIDGYTKNYAPHTDLSVESTVATPNVSWEWPFSTSNENDVKDTALGDKAADGSAATISLTVVTTVTQID